MTQDSGMFAACSVTVVALLAALGLTIAGCAPDLAALAPVVQALQNDPAAVCIEIILPPPYGVQVYVSRVAADGTISECGGKLQQGGPRPPTPPASPPKAP